MYGIEITQTIKNQNAQNWVKNKSVGDIVILSQLPNKFFVTENVVGGYKEREDLHGPDGWRPFVPATFDPATQATTDNIIIVDGNFTNELRDLTQEEIDQNLSDQEDAEDEQEEQEHEDAGLQLIRRTRKRLRRRVKKGLLTQNQSNKLRRWFSTIFYNLRLGDWDLADEDINADSFPTPANAKLQTEIAKLKERISDYLTNQYSK